MPSTTACTQPTITSVTPSTWVAGQTYNAVVRGSGFLTPTDNCNVVNFGLVFTNPGNETLEFSVVSDTEITGTVTLPASEPTQLACFTAFDWEADVVRRTSGVSSTACPAGSYGYGYGTVVPFPVSVCSIPTITSISPNVWFTGQSPNITITGTGFITSALSAATGCPVSTVKVTTSNSGLLSPTVLSAPVSNTNVVSGNQITASVTPKGAGLSNPTGAFYSAMGAFVNVISVPPPPTHALNTSGPAGATAPVDVVGTTAIEWTNKPNATTAPIISGPNANLPNPTAVVGQQIVLTGLPTAANFNGLPISLTIPSPSTWTVGGTNIGGYNPTTAGASVIETTLMGPTLTTYWAYPGTYPVTYESCVESQTATPALDDCTTVTATFEVTGGGAMASNPWSANLLTIDQLIPCVDGQPPVGGGAQEPFVVYGLITGTNCSANLGSLYGITFTPSGAPAGGTYSFVQLINSDDPASTQGAIKNHCTTTPGVDQAYPYKGIIPGSNPPRAEDAPGDSLTPGFVESRTFSATMFLLWTPPGTNSIPVPIGYQTWGFTGGAQQEDGTWVALTDETQPPGLLGGFVISSDETKPGPPALDHGFPIWSGPATCN